MKIEDLKRRVETAVQERNKASMMFVNRYGDVNEVSASNAPTEIQTVFEQLLEKVDYCPYFIICTVVDGVIDNQIGDVISIDDLPIALKEAQDERIRFYSEREKEYGESAWPVSYA